MPQFPERNYPYYVGNVIYMLNATDYKQCASEKNKECKIQAQVL